MLPAMCSRSVVVFSATILALSLGAEKAVAQDSEMEMRIEERQRDYIAAATSGDADAFLDVFTDEAVVIPVTGGTYEGTEEIRRYFDEAGRFQSLDIRSTRVERVGDIIVDVGTFAGTLPAEAGGHEVSGEYIVLAREENGGIKIHRLVSFPTRGLSTGQ